ncbi:hypothetical protein BN1318_390022 [Staphylococcus capitis]|nr:hypothetical protein BN1318_390022 [Staphylococcus capitis]
MSCIRHTQARMNQIYKYMFEELAYKEIEAIQVVSNIYFLENIAFMKRYKENHSKIEPLSKIGLRDTKALTDIEVFKLLDSVCYQCSEDNNLKQEIESIVKPIQQLIAQKMVDLEIIRKTQAYSEADTWD